MQRHTVFLRQLVAVLLSSVHLRRGRLVLCGLEDSFLLLTTVVVTQHNTRGADSLMVNV